MRNIYFHPPSAHPLKGGKEKMFYALGKEKTVIRSRFKVKKHRLSFRHAPGRNPGILRFK